MTNDLNQLCLCPKAVIWFADFWGIHNAKYVVLLALYLFPVNQENVIYSSLLQLICCDHYFRFASTVQMHPWSRVSAHVECTKIVFVILTASTPPTPHKCHAMRWPACKTAASEDCLIKASMIALWTALMGCQVQQGLWHYVYPCSLSVRRQSWQTKLGWWTKYADKKMYGVFTWMHV